MTTRSVPTGKALSACHTIAGSRPEISRSARAMSRSRLMPGKTTTADFIAASKLCSSVHFDPVILDHGIRQKLLGGAFERRLGAGPIGAFNFNIEDLALADASDPTDPKRAQCAFDGLALRIKNAGLERDGDARLHGPLHKYESVRPQYRGAGPAIWGKIEENAPYGFAADGRRFNL